MSYVTQTMSTPGITDLKIWNRFGELSSHSVTYPTAGSGLMSRTSSSTPSFVSRRAEGTLPELPFKFTEKYRSAVTGRTLELSYSLTKPIGWYTSSLKEGVYSSWNVDSNPISIGSVRVANLRNEVIAKLRGKMKDQPVNLAVLAGEGRETVTMLKDLSVRIGSLLVALRTGDTQKFLRTIRFDGVRGRGKLPPRIDAVTSGQAANLHLMYWYGIRPLVSDILGTVKALEKGLRETKYQIVTARSVLDDSITVPSASVQNAFVYWRSRVEVSARVKFGVSSSVLATLTDLGLTNPFEVVWELTKLSFVLDWGIGIGNWLGQIDSSLGKQVLSSSVTTFERSEGRLVVHESDFRVNAYVRRWRDLEANEWQVACNREAFPQGSLPIALFPSVVPRLELFQALTGLSLLRQRM